MGGIGNADGGEVVKIPRKFSKNVPQKLINNSCQEWSGDGDLPVELSGILGVADMQRLLSTTKTDRQKKKRKQ